jgi:hypothetical protein
MRRRILGEFISEDLASSLDQHYVHAVAGEREEAERTERRVQDAIRELTPDLVRAQRIAIAGVVTFVAFLAWHAWDHRVPLFVASLAGFLVSILGIVRIRKIVRLALYEARVEFAEYYFLFPLFLSISLLAHAGFFDPFEQLLRNGIEYAGPGHIAFTQFLSATVLSALLDNNVVADFGARAIGNLELSLIHLFAMAQIAGYATGGCWTHIGSAQSVVAFAFIRRDVDEEYTPISWIKEMTPVILQLIVVLTALIYVESLLLDYLG